MSYGVFTLKANLIICASTLNTKSMQKLKFVPGDGIGATVRYKCAPQSRFPCKFKNLNLIGKFACVVGQANQRRAYWHVWFDTPGCIRMCFFLFLFYSLRVWCAHTITLLFCLIISFTFKLINSCRRHWFDLLNPLSVSDRDKNLSVYMYLPEGVSFIWFFH